MSSDEKSDKKRVSDSITIYCYGMPLVYDLDVYEDELKRFYALQNRIKNGSLEWHIKVKHQDFIKLIEFLSNVDGTIYTGECSNTIIKLLDIFCIEHCEKKDDVNE
jgi:hypothetical protein